MDTRSGELPAPAEMQKAGVALVDGQPVFRFGLSQLISKEAGLEVCWEATSESEALRLLERCKPAIVIVELSLSAGSGIELIRRIRQSHPRMSVLVLSMYEDEHYVERALRAGASGYMMKREDGERVLIAIKKLLAGQTLLSDNLSPALLKRLIVTREDEGGSAIDQLSDRELQIYSMIGGGKGRREIADELHLSAKTVETYQAHIKRKLGLGDARKLVHHAVRWTLAQESKGD